MFGTRDKIRIIGLALTGIWLVLLLLFWWLAPGDGQSTGAARIVTFIGAIMPLAVIWLTVAVAGAVSRLEDEARDLRERISRLQDLATPPKRAMPDAPAEPARTALRPPSQQPTPQSSPPRRVAKPAPTRQPTASQQTAMQFDTPESVEISSDILIRALNFPDNAEDHETIAALRSALKDHDLARVLRGAQDVITLMAGSGLYMDHLEYRPAPADIWRRFAEGDRGASIAPIGKIEDEDALEAATALTRGDEIFRDSAHHFMRHYDRMLTTRSGQLDDAQLEALAATRSSRAFILLGKVAGIFG